MFKCHVLLVARKYVLCSIVDEVGNVNISSIKK